jgi:hypothetical protein
MDKFRYLMVAGAASCFLPLGCASSPPPAARAAQVEQLQCGPEYERPGRLSNSRDHESDRVGADLFERSDGVQ